MTLGGPTVSTIDETLDAFLAEQHKRRASGDRLTVVAVGPDEDDPMPDRLEISFESDRGVAVRLSAMAWTPFLTVP